MSRCKSLILLSAFWLLALTGHAQTAPTTKTPPTRQRRQLIISFTLPSAVGVVTKYASALLSKSNDTDKEQRKKQALRTSNPVVEIALPLPKGWLDGKPD